MTTKAYLIGGRNAGTYYNDWWETSDGENWAKKGTLPFTFSYAYPHAACYNNGELFVIPTKTSDVWVYNGSTWSKRATGKFPARSYAALIYYKGKLWLFGDTITPSIYTSDDNGVTWVANNSFTIASSGVAQGLSAVVVNDILIVGFNGTTFYQTTDGIVWTSKTVSTYNGTSNFIPLNTSNFLGEAWGSSSSINNSIRRIDITNYSALNLFVTVNENNKRITAPGILKFGNYIYHIGGQVYGTTSTNAWKKYDATSATLISTGTAQFEARDSFAIVQFEEVDPPADLIGGIQIQSQSYVNLTADLLSIYLNASASISDTSSIEILANPFNISSSLEAGFKIEASSRLKTNGDTFNAILNGYTSSITIGSQVKSGAELVDPSSILVTLTNIVKNNGIPISNAKVIAIRDSDNKVFTAISDSVGAWSLKLELGTYHIACVYKDGSENVFGLVKPYVVIQ